MAAVSVMVGPSVGLWSGGRGDLARRGLILRGICIGGIAFVAAFGDAINPGSTSGLVILGRASILVTAVSGVYDLVITRSATARGPPPRAQLGVRPDGRMALSLRF